MSEEHIERSEELKTTPPNTASKPWPKGVRTVSWNEMDLLGVDRQGRLYWDGRAVEVRELTLKWPERTLAVSGILVAIVAVVIQSWQWGCELAWLQAGWCPPF